MDRKGLNDEDIGVLVDAKIKEATGGETSLLSTERAKVTKYYNGELPKRQSEGNSTYVSRDVYDAVEAMKAQLLETFAAGYEIIKFDPQGPNDVEPCRIASEYTDYVLFRQNDGYKIFNDVIHDGLTSRVGIAKVYWEKCEEHEEHEFDGLDEAAVHGLASQDDIPHLDAEMDEETGTFKGKLSKKLDYSQVKVEVINPEEFSIEPQAKSLSPDYFCAHRTIKTIGDLVKMGYDRKKLEEYKIEDSSTLNQSEEVLARFRQTDNGLNSDGREQSDTRQVVVSEAYLKITREGDEYPKLYKVVRCGNLTLEIEEVDRLPFVAFVPLPVPHSFYGSNFAAGVIPTQNAVTVLARGVLDHTAITNNPRYQVLKGGLTNPRELLDNRLGGIVNVTRPDAVTPLAQASLNPFTYQTMEMLKARNEETTGISSLSQGLNKDAISKQNSAAMVENLVSLSQTRQKIIARNFANGFLIPLWIEIYRLVLANESKQSIVELAGNWVEVNPKTWVERKNATVSLHLGYGEQEREAQKYISMLALAKSDPSIEQMITPDNLYYTVTKIMKLNGIKGVSDHITPPEKIPPKQPDPMLIKKMELEERAVAAQEKLADAQVQKVEVHAQLDTMKQTLAKMQKDFDNSIKSRKEDRADAEAANKIDVSQRETKLLEEAPPESFKAIDSPNG